MVTRIDESVVPNLPTVSEQSGTPAVRSDVETYRNLAGLLVSGELAGTQSGEFLKIFRSTTADINLMDLPFEVASMILENRAATMKEFFESWSESLQEQSKLDKEAHQRREKDRQGFPASERHFVSCLAAAERTGTISVEEVSLLKGELGLLAANGEIAVGATLSKDDGGAKAELAALEPPKSTGFGVRTSSVDLRDS